MSESCKKMIKFLIDKDPERHVWPNHKDLDSAQEFNIFLQSYQIVEFLEIIPHIDDGGYEAHWLGEYFALDIAPFIEHYCEDLFTLREFIDLVGHSDE